MQEIWLLQPRFGQRQRKRVFRLLAHPRFRAAFDLLALRAEVGLASRELVDWWHALQQASPQQRVDLAESSEAPAGGARGPGASAGAGGGSRSGGRRRRRRGGRGGRGGGGGSGQG